MTLKAQAEAKDRAGQDSLFAFFCNSNCATGTAPCCSNGEPLKEGSSCCKPPLPDLQAPWEAVDETMSVVEFRIDRGGESQAEMESLEPPEKEIRYLAPPAVIQAMAMNSSYGSSKQSSRAADRVEESLMSPEEDPMSIIPLLKVMISGILSALVAGAFSAISLALSAIWAVPGHQQATLWGGLMNRIIWAVSPLFLGSFFPGLCNPDLMCDWRNHLFFLSVSLTPFVIADVAFPYVVGSDTNFKVFFSTCFWPTTTCLFFVPSMVAAIRNSTGDKNWLELRSQIRYIRSEGRHFWLDLLRLIACFFAAVLPVNYIALDFAVVLPSLHPTAAAIFRPMISLLIKVGCFEIFKFCAFGLGKSMMLYGIFPLSFNIGLHGAMSAVLCQDWLSVAVWVFCDFVTCIWRTQRVRVAQKQSLAPVLPYLPSWFHENHEQIRRRGLESIILGWGLTGALASVLMVYPFTALLPDMLQGFLFPQGTTSLMFLAVVAVSDVTLDIVTLVMLTKTCRYDFGKILGYQPFSRTLRYAYLSTLAVVWAPCALGCFGWVFHHMCVAAFESSC